MLDLPQQLGQIRLFFQVLAGTAAAGTRIEWLAPNKLAYLLLGAAWKAGGPTVSPRLAIWLAALLWIGAIHFLAAKLDRPPEHATLASIFVWNNTFYGGFFNFLAGFPVAALWLVELESRKDRSFVATALYAFVAALLLAGCHVFWVALGMAFLLMAAGIRSATGIAAAPRRASGIATGARLIGFAPVLVATALWYRAFRSTGWENDPVWGVAPLDRLLSPAHLVSEFLGGLRSDAELWIAGAVAAWALYALLSNRKSEARSDRILFAVAALLFALAVALPENLGRTAMLARRFAPPAAAFFLVALPAARAPRIFRRLVPAAVFLAMIAVTTQSWVGFERDETAGLEECVAAVPEGSRLLALDYVRTSAYFWIGPFMHIGAYAAVERGAWLAIDFADLPTSLVVRDPPPPERRFTPALEIQPRHLKPRDLDLCDYVLVVGETFDYAQFEPRFPRLEVVKSSGRFRLYRVRPAVST